MSTRETVAKRRPMIDLEQFEKRLRQTTPSSRSDDDPLAELARFAGDRDDPYKAVFEHKAARPAIEDRDAQDGYETPADHDSWPQAEPDPFDPHRSYASAVYAPESEDFPHPGERRRDREEEVANYSAPFEQAQEWRYQEEAPYAAPDYEAEPRSRRPLYIMAAIIIAGIGGIGATFALKGGSSSSHMVASIKAVDGPVKVQPETTGGVDSPNQNASILDRTPQASPVAVADGSEQPVDLSRMPDRAPRVIAMNGSGSGAASVAAPPPPGRAQAPQGSEERSIANLIEPKKVKTVSVRPDGSVIANDPIAAAAAAPVPEHHAATVAAKPATPKTTTRAATTPKPAAPGDAAVNAAAKPAAKTRSVEVASADAQATPAAGGGYAAQLAAPASEAEARDIQGKLIKKYGAQIAGFHPSIRKAVSGDKTVYRVRSVGLSKEDATSLCQKVQGAGGACFVAKN
ncbi:Sporulation domain protein [Methylocella silvestris BL2]|uniref:Sporulation domain protein n=1 Tax=Methylocella silvestris (strain DSM 15510 / CIP 108128 / LMG 27833 / NCIMB 13906 / BL2) TaxID=395965 RepID=B8EJR4_METSB|nr:SPOR domain-containing protein [Methylocella silvestris]ACK49468.1 Sporulation domain protein [Methylocella silvestris BL2]